MDALVFQGCKIHADYNHFDVYQFTAGNTHTAYNLLIDAYLKTYVDILDIVHQMGLRNP